MNSRELEMEPQVKYYEELLDFLDDMVPCLDDLIIIFDEEYEEQ